MVTENEVIFIISSLPSLGFFLQGRLSLSNRDVIELMPCQFPERQPRTLRGSRKVADSLCEEITLKPSVAFHVLFLKTKVIAMMIFQVLAYPTLFSDYIVYIS